MPSSSSLSKTQFDCRDQSAIEQRRQELVAQHEGWLASQPEIKEVLADFMQSLLIHKPEDPLAFMKKYFTEIRATTGGAQ